MHRDRLDEARMTLEGQLAKATAVGDEVSRSGLLMHLTELECRAGNWRRADELASECRELYERRGLELQGSVALYARGMVDAHLGRVAECRAAAEQELSIAETTGDAIFRWQLRGVLGFLPWTARCGRGLEAVREAFRRALAEHERTGPFERGRTLFALGSLERRAKQKRVAREALEAGLAVFEQLGARLWAARARSELSLISGRAPASEALTGAELRVAELVAHGSTNREVAAAARRQRKHSRVSPAPRLPQARRSFPRGARPRLRREGAVWAP
jgi:hypothetical protein